MPDYEINAKGRTFTISSPRELTPEDLRGRIDAVLAQLDPPKAEATDLTGPAYQPASKQPASSLVFQPGFTNPTRTRGRVRDVAPIPQTVAAPRIAPQPQRLPGDPGGISVAETARRVQAQMAQTSEVVALRNLPFDPAHFYSVVVGGGRTVKYNEPSSLAGHRNPWTSPKKAALMVARALDIPDEKAARLLDPKSREFALLKDYIRQGHGAGKPASDYGLALQAGASPQAAAVVEADPGIKDATTPGQWGRAFGAAAAPSKAIRILAGDRRKPEEVPAWEAAGETLFDILAFGAAGRVGAAASEGVAGAVARKGLQSVTAKTLAGFAGDKAATGFVGRVAERATSFAIENTTLQAVPIIGHASDLTEQNGKPFLVNLRTAGGEAAKGFVEVMNPAIFTDPDASAQDKAVAAVMQGAMLLGAGFKGYDWVTKRGKALGIDPIIVERLVQEGRREAQRRAGGTKGPERIPLPGEPDTPRNPSPVGAAASKGRPPAERVNWNDSRLWMDNPNVGGDDVPNPLFDRAFVDRVIRELGIHEDPATLSDVAASRLAQEELYRRDTESLRKGSSYEGHPLSVPDEASASDFPAPGHKPPVASGSQVDLADPSLSKLTRRKRPGSYLDSDRARTKGEVPVVVGETPPGPVSPLRKDGEALVRNDADRSRLAAMVEEFGEDEGLRRFIADREAMPRPPIKAEIVTGDEMSAAEHKVWRKKLDRMKADRARLDELPTVPENVRERLIRSVDPEDEKLDPYSDHYDDDLAATLHGYLFGEAATRDVHGDLSEEAVSAVRDGLRAEQTTRYNRESHADAIANADDIDHVGALALSSGVKRDPETTKDYIADVDRRDIPDGPEDIITARRANNRRGWKVNHSRTSWIRLEGVHERTARALVEFALSKESDHSYLRRTEWNKWKQKGIRPKFLKLSEMIEKEVGTSWQDPGFEDWHRIGIPRPVVAEYIRNRMAEAETAREVLKSVAPSLTEQEIRDVIEHAARGGEFPASDSRAGYDRTAHDGGSDAVDGRAPSGDLRGGRPASPRRHQRERLDREIASLEDRLARAKVVDSKTPRVARLGDPPPGERKPLLGPDGRRADGKPSVTEANKGRKANRNRELILPDAVAASKVKAGDPTLREYDELDVNDPDVQKVAKKAAESPVEKELSWRNITQPSRLREISTAWMSKRRQKPMPVPALGVEVRFSANAVEKLRKKDMTGQRMVPLIPDLLLKAELVYNTKPRDLAKTGMTGTWVVARLDTVQDGNYNVYMFLRRMHNGDFQYDHGYQEVVKAWPASNPSGVRNATEPEASTTSGQRRQVEDTPPLVEVPKDEPKGRNPTETRNADTEAERAAAGTAPVERQDYTTKAQADAKGKKAVENGADHVALAEEIATRPRPIDAIENGVLKEGRRRLFDQAREARAKRDAAEKAGDADAAARHHADYLLARDRIDKNTEALVKGGRELSAAFGARRGEEPVDLADPETVVQEARWAKGDGSKATDLDPKAETRLRALADQLREAEAREVEADAGRRAAEAELARVKREGFEERRAARAERKIDLKAEMADLSEQFGKSMMGTANAGLPIGPDQIKLLAKMGRNAVQQGALTVEEMIDFVRTHLPESVREDIDDRTIRDAFSGYGAEPNKDKSETQARLEEMKRVAAVLSQIEDAEAGSLGAGRSRAKVSAELARLRKVRDAIRKEKGLARSTTRAAKSVEEVIASLEKRKAEIDALTAKGETPAKKSRATETDAVQEARKALRAALLRNRASATIRKLERQLALGKFEEARKAAIPSEEQQRLQFEVDKLRRKVRAAIEAQRPKGFGEKALGVAVEIANIPRTIKTSFDLSAALRQGAMLTLANPREAKRAFGEQIAAFRSAPYAAAANKAIVEGPRAMEYQRAGLYLSELDSPDLNKHEEAFLSRIAVDKLPGVKGSERAYVVYLNTLRASVFDKMTEGRGLTLEEKRQVANYINVATGRGHMPGFEHSANALSTIFFSPRYLTSRFEVLAGGPMWKASPKARKLIAAEYGKYVGTIAAVLMIAKGAGASVSLKPDDPDFLKIKLGDTRIDILSGLQQALRFVLRMAGVGKSDPEKVAKQFVRSKLAPAPGYAWSVRTGKDFAGKKFKIADAAKDTITPMIYADTKEAIEAQGLPKGLALGIMSGLGLGVNTYKSGK